MTAPAPAFDLTGPLPHGTHLLEASAGTGKTFAIAALAARFLAEGVVPIENLLIVTFGRSANRELRDRVRGRLLMTAAALAAARAGGPTPADPALAALCAVPDDELARRAERIETALLGIDTAAIETTHGFCRTTLRRLGVAVDADPLETFEDDEARLVDEVTTDLYLAAATTSADGAPPPFPLAEAGVIARAVVGDPQSALAVDAPAGSTAAARVSFAQAVRAEYRRRRRAGGVTTYDDLVSRVADALADPVTGPAARAVLRRQFPVVMVDEFQDTDALQWQVLRDAFHDHSTLLLIGDPKQAVYAFRGGDIETYLRADREAHRHATLDRNHRSDPVLVEAVNDLFRDVALGSSRITARPVRAARTGRRLAGPGTEHPIRLRSVPDDPTARAPRVDAVRGQVARDVAADIARSLTAGITLSGAPLRPGDIAVLVEQNNQAELVHDELRRLGVAAVLTNSTNVFGSPAAGDWLTALTAMQQRSTRSVRRVMLTPFFGLTGDDLARGGDELLDEATGTVRSWVAAFEATGIAGVLARMAPELTERLLARAGGERLLTDLRHVADELHAQRALGLPGLADWLRSRIAESARRAEESSRRLDTDAEAVQLVTIHRSKGLEFPITYIPFSWNRWRADADKRVVVRRHEIGRRLLDVRGAGAADWDQAVATADAEDDGERLRLLYVALTRASCQVVLWWARSRNTPGSALQRLVGARLGGAAGRVVTPDEHYPCDRLGLAQVAQVLGAPEPPGHPTPRPQPESARDPELLRAAVFDRRLDFSWRRTSYTALTAGAHAAAGSAGVGDSGPPDERHDETDSDSGPDGVPGTPPAGAAAESPMAALPVGATFGVLAHAVYEEFDADRASDPHTELLRCAGLALRRRPLPGLTPELMADSFLPSVTTPWGPAAADRTLATIARRDRLPELEFELPLAGGDTPRGTLTAAGLIDAFRALPSDDPLAGYADRLATAGLPTGTWTGFLTGSIDAVVRVGDRHLVVDYKTNWLGGSIESATLPLVGYGHAAMAAAMMAAHYPLQALLYQVALHRFLRSRLAAYDPQRHLGGALYLFVRGMAGPATLRDGVDPFGVFRWQPPAELVVDVSDTLAGGLP